MPPEAAAAALFSALIHASWNAVLKRGEDRVSDSFFVGLGSLIFALAIIASRGAPNAATIPFLALSAIAHAAYWWTLIKSYDAGDLSHIYTLARGSAPMLVAIGAAFTAREMPAGADAIGIVLVSLGILCVGASAQAPLRATSWALATGVCIASYSLIDGLGARASGDPILYIGWSTLVMAGPLAAFALARRGPRALAARARKEGLRGLLIGAISSAGFGIVLWAQARAPLAQVTALRETSVVFAALISWLFLKEAMTARRWLGAGIVAAGGLLIGFF